jgi:ubiquinone/menaquinone biosynthesis C-methylase UbiE
VASCHLYEDLSAYYDRFCQDIPYALQAETLQRLVHLFNDSKGEHYLDIACGTGQLMAHTQDFGWQLAGLDNSANMLNQAALRCPQAQWILADMAKLPARPQFNFASCLLYSMHYNGDMAQLTDFFRAVWQALLPGGFIVFDCVDKRGIDNSAGITTYYQEGEQYFTFHSHWAYGGEGNQQSLQLSIALNQNGRISAWQDEHPMVAVSIVELEAILAEQGFITTLFERNFEQLIAWQGESFNLMVVAQKPLGALV